MIIFFENFLKREKFSNNAIVITDWKINKIKSTMFEILKNRFKYKKITRSNTKNLENVAKNRLQFDSS